jgi:hypothetical protein
LLLNPRKAANIQLAAVINHSSFLKDRIVNIQLIALNDIPDIHSGRPNDTDIPQGPEQPSAQVRSSAKADFSDWRQVTVAKLSGVTLDSSATHIAVCAIARPDAAARVNQFQKHLSGQPSNDSPPYFDFSDVCVLYESDPVPKSLGASFEGVTGLLVRRNDRHDIICVPRQLLETASTEDTLLQTVVRSTRLRHCSFGDGKNTAASALRLTDRFPKAGPDKPALPLDLLISLMDQDAPIRSMSATSRSCMKSGLLLIQDHLESSHQISQTLEGKGTPRTADYWHAIMHRREPDPENASYWFRRVGPHPALDILHSNLGDWIAELEADDDVRQLTTELLLRSDTWKTQALTELSRKAIQKPGSPEDRTVRIIQYLEMLNLLQFTLNESP